MPLLRYLKSKIPRTASRLYIVNLFVLYSTTQNSNLNYFGSYYWFTLFTNDQLLITIDTNRDPYRDTTNMQKKKATGTKTAAGSRSMKRDLDTGVEVYDNRVKKNQHHTTNEKPNMYLNIFDKNKQYFDP